MEGEEAFRARRLLSNPVNFKIAKILIESGEPMAFSDIKKRLDREGISGSRIWSSLQTLVKAELVKNFRKLELNPETGKAKLSFFEITEKGQMLVSVMEKAVNNLRSR